MRNIVEKISIQLCMFVKIELQVSGSVPTVASSLDSEADHRPRGVIKQLSTKYNLVSQYRPPA